MSHVEIVYSTAPTISIVTATYDAAALLPRLVVSLREQSDQDFEWIVADGGSIDDTVQIVEEAKISLRKVVLMRQPDFGIYDALNRAIKSAQGNFYLVIGADDEFHPEAVANYKKAIASSSADLVTAQVRTKRGICGPKALRWSWLYGMNAYVSGHSVGLAMRRSLHQQVGYYSRELPIAADSLFILKAIKNGARVSVHDFEAGYYESEDGTSGRDVLGNLMENYHVQLAIGESRLIQKVILIVRLIKNWKKVIRSFLLC